MIYFDKLKLVTCKSYGTILDSSNFVEKWKNKVLVKSSFNQTVPYSLIINVNEMQSELTIEFTSKILGAKYFQFITATTIQECLEIINSTGIIELDIEKIYNNSKVVKCDIANDLIITEDYKQFITNLRNNISNYNKWSYKPIKGNFIIDKAVTTPRNKRRTTFYDKLKELLKKTNEPFLVYTGCRDEILEQARNKVRVELNLVAEEAIRNVLGIQDNTLVNVLNSEAEPLKDILNEIFTINSISHSLKGSSKGFIYLALEKCDFNPHEAEKIIRPFYSDNTPFSKIRSRIQNVLNEINKNNTFNILSYLK